MCSVGINVRMSWQALHSLPSHPNSHTNTLLPRLEHMVRQQRHLATLPPGSCASSSPVGSLGTATSSTTCGSSRVKRGAMNYSKAAAANLTFIQEIHCKHMTASQNKHHPHTNAWSTTWLSSLYPVAMGFVCPDVMSWFIWGERGRILCNDSLSVGKWCWKIKSEAGEDINDRNISLSFHSKQMNGWPFNSAIITSHSIYTGGFVNQGHFAEPLNTFPQWRHGLMKSFVWRWPPLRHA